MSSEFYDLYNSYSQKELFDVLLNPSDYQPEAIDCATQIVAEKKWADDYQKAIDLKRAEQQQEQELEQEDIEAKADYYRKAVSIKMQRHSYSVLLSDTSKLEAKLAELNIEYFVDTPSDFLQLNSASTQTYYFKAEDTDTVDRICRDLGISDNSFTVQKTEFNFQLKLIVFIVLGILLILGVRYLFSK